ncbi:MAG: Spore protein SP21 [candidate division WS2 bacterium ADurb.Bin280]|uniref:Spore protein SP21 n=1 Tax=candidate division WS2 bacterium ADurb.Bin280 TaxID=1852829 RepID=A0A1V5SEI5_9BACT|nr:MAG: Spore protein SP21 [candidate division WS2 bacterium ADurb.Bin280]
MRSFLKKFREKADLTQGELADDLGVSRQSIIALESGRCVPSVSLAMKIAGIFDVPIEFIFRFEDDADIDSENCESEKNNKKGGSMVRELMPWSPWREMMSLRETMDRFFDEPAMSRGSSVFYPSIGIRETAKDLVVEADLPGVKEEDVSIEVEDNQLIIKGERKHREEKKREDYYHLESSYGAFSRVITLPSNVDSSKTQAEFEGGILEIRIPKMEERKAKKISIKSKGEKKIESPVKGAKEDKK